MADRLTKAQRSYCMSRVRGKDTSLERRVRSELHMLGYRFRKHVVTLPGKPDIVFLKKKTAVFIDGDFWHGWRFPQWKDTLSLFWQHKIIQTRKRDRRNFQRLRSMGWKVIRIWEHQLEKDFSEAISRIRNSID